ncbi:hypothetical protein J437_LFUL004055, partial [Ladona fulva]
GCHPIQGRRPSDSATEFGINSLNGGNERSGQRVIHLGPARKTQVQSQPRKMQRTGWHVMQEAVMRRIQPDGYAVASGGVGKIAKHRHKQGVLVFRHNCCT